jgi:hypothetical protein
MTVVEKLKAERAFTAFVTGEEAPGPPGDPITARPTG